MNKRDITIAILDVDQFFKTTTKEFFEKEGYTCLVFSDYEQLLSSTKLRKVDVFIIECLTQKTSLNNLVKSLLDDTAESNPLFIFVSMILDKTSVKDVLNMTKSPHFFKKPVVPAQILPLIVEKFADQIPEAQEPFLELLHTPQLASNERITAIQQTPSCHGFEVPRVLSYLFKTSFTGTISFKNSELKDAVVYYKNGNIIKVEVDDPKSFFGALLVDKNFVTLEELELVLQQKNAKRIGERLIDSNLVSPHVIDMVNVEQLGIRLGYIIKNTSYDISLDEKPLDIESLFMDIQTMQRFVSDWLNSKISVGWLKTFFMPHMSKKILKASLFADISPLHTIAPLNRMPKFANDAIQGVSLEQLLETKKYSEEEILQAMHLLITQEFVCFDRQIKTQDHKAHHTRLTKIKNDMENQNYFEILGLSDKAKTAEIRRAYLELSKLFHPDKLSPQSPQEIRELTTFVFTKISKANEILSDEIKRGNYVQELEKGNAEKILQSESLLDEGRSLLKSNQASRAMQCFEKALSLRPPTSEMRLFYLWSKILCMPKSGIEEFLKKIEFDLNKIPPEDRHNGIYYFVKGLYLKQIGDLDTAERTIKHALSMSSNFIEAQRELNIISLQKKGSKPVDLMNADLKDVVGMLFKKKK